MSLTGVLRCCFALLGRSPAGNADCIGLFALLAAGLIAACFSSAAAQTTSRAQQIQQTRLQKVPHLQPERESKWVERLKTFSEPGSIARFLKTGEGRDGFTPLAFGGTRSGHGWSFGPGYSRRYLLGGRAQFSSRARVTVTEAYLLDAKLTLPWLENHHTFLELVGKHEDSPRMDYFGSGPDSQERDRSSYRLEDTNFDLTAGVRPFRPLKLGGTVGYLMVNTGPGKRPGYPSTDEVFDPQQAPGLDRQTNFLRYGSFLQLDWRDFPEGARSGGNYAVRMVYYDDRKLGQHDYYLLDLEAEHYIPYLNRSHVLALAGQSQLTFRRQDQVVPFYLQPYLGSSHSLRGFHRYRFRDDNFIHAAAEHRWEAFSHMDVALFFEAGKVAPRRSHVNFHDLEYSGGFGFRLKVDGAIFMRIDTGFSREGVMIWWTWSDVF